MRSFFRIMPAAFLGMALTVSAQTPQTQTPTQQPTQDQTQTGTTRGTADMPATSANWLAMVLGGGVLAAAGLAARRK